MVRKAVCIALMCLMPSCGMLGASGTWQQRTRVALTAAAKASATAAEMASGDKYCRPFLDECKRTGDKTCGKLARCQMSQQALLKAMQQLFTALDNFSTALTLSEMFSSDNK